MCQPLVSSSLKRKNDAMHNELEARKAGNESQHVLKFHALHALTRGSRIWGSGGFPDPVTDLIPAPPLDSTLPVQALAQGGLSARNAIHHPPQEPPR